MKKVVILSVLLLSLARIVSAQKLDVKIIDRQNHDMDYSYVVPGHVYANSNANVNCSGDGNNVNCNGSSRYLRHRHPSRGRAFSCARRNFISLTPGWPGRGR